MGRLAMLLATASAVLLLGPGSWAADGHPGAVATAVKVIRALGRGGSPAVAYALLHPVQQQLIPRRRFIHCQLAGRGQDMPSQTIRVLGVWAFRVRTQRIPERQGLMVQMVVTDHFGKHVVDRGSWGVPLVRVHGAWRWLLDWPTVDWYRAHPAVCPE